LEREIIEKQRECIEKIRDINKVKNLHYYILTMGCKLNENDSEKIARGSRSYGLHLNRGNFKG